MAESGQFRLGLRLLTVLAKGPGTMHTSAAIAEELGESPVVVRRMFLLLHKAGLIEQKKGPNGGAKLMIPAKQIGVGTVYGAVSKGWLVVGDASVDGVMKKVRAEAIAAMNETTLNQVVKKLRKA
ncbi:RrF2 family transcriptional regulator [Granulicella sibirica]|nr:Rrf2 family transcriptional regulator [Granulicella sibirica]